MNTEHDEERIWSIIEVREVADEVLREFFYDKEMPPTIFIRYRFYGKEWTLGSFFKSFGYGSTSWDYDVELRYTSMTRKVLRVVLIHELCHAYVAYNNLDCGKDHHRKAWRILAKEMSERSGYVIQKYVTLEDSKNHSNLPRAESEEFFEWYHGDLDYIGSKQYPEVPSNEYRWGARVFPPKTHCEDAI